MPLPMFHIFGMVIGMLMPAWLHCKTVLMSSFDLVSFLGLIQTHRVTKTFLVPPILLALAKHPVVDKFDLSSLEVIGSGAAPLGADTARAVEARLGCVVKQGWGMTELSPVRARQPGQAVHWSLPEPNAVSRYNCHATMTVAASCLLLCCQCCSCPGSLLLFHHSSNNPFQNVM